MKKILFFMLFTLFVNVVHSQVGINTESPSELSVLDIVNYLDENNKIVPKGIMIPRMTEADRDKIDISNASSANSLMIYNTTEDCYNYYSFIESDWRSLCGKLGKAEFDFDCSNIEVLGTYTQGVDLTSSNRLKITTTVSKAGTYDIIATTTNGYYFTVSGTFATTGTFVIYADGVGKPAAIQTDVVAITKNGEDVECASPLTITVVDPTAKYSLNCSSVVVNGMYLKGTPLAASNTIIVNVSVSSTGSYSISTEEKHGVHFVAAGTFTTTGTKSITLVGTGNPTINEDFDVSIISNSPDGNTNCTATIEITLPPLTYAIIGSNNYSWASDARQTAINNGESFGTNGVIKIASLTRSWSVTNASAAYSALTNGSEKPDVILYFAYGADVSSDLATALVSYVNDGGVLIYGPADNAYRVTNILLDGIFGSGVITASNMSSTRNSYLINNLSNDPIVNGPFGNVGGRYWSEDNAGTVMCSALPAGCIQVAPANNVNTNSEVSPENSVVWYSESKNFAYFGDCVYGTAPTRPYYGTTDGSAPTQFNSGGLPENKLNKYISSTPVYMYNSYLELNVLAWALRKAAVSGINPH